MYLTPLQPSDIPVVKKWLGNEPLLRAVTSEAPDMTKPYYSFIIRLNDGTPVGWVDIFDVDELNRKAEAGIAIPERRGRGLSHRAAKRAIRFAFDNLGLHRLYLRIPESNTRSIRLAELLGFEKEGVERQAVNRSGNFEDIIVYGLLNVTEDGE